ncbi:MAG: DUF805 domain-containing protein [Sphingobacterium sp.]|jgi:uncharacterized membrane protein YhaH (DUF805 family)|uniref:DUF805 domain-containing protein n=1 Tax=Sphingobacterium tabacisoli TaxID=2044855 RepID=A0ABW5KYS4_9SPHI|nr:DUF805 domain-containing protein [Sphingobacterium tabacisoli]MDR2281950.1 DUF805 domain-containing protein [Sphingobacterium sp.]
MEWYLKVVRDNYANFNGRARRKEYWMFFLINVGISLVLSLIDSVFGLKMGGNEMAAYGGGTGVIGGIYSLAVFIPGLAVTVRRLHDSGKSGWNYLWVLTCIGAFYVLYLLIQEGDRGQNQYGEDPKGGENEDPFAGQREINNPFSGQNNPFKNDNQ